MSALSIEQNLERLAEAQERTATALEAILAHLGSSTAGFTASGTSITVADDPEAAAEEAAKLAAAVQASKLASEADKKAAAAGAKKKADEAAAAAKKAAEEAAAAAAAEVDPLADAPAEVKKEITIEDVRKALMDYRAIEGAPAMMEVLKTHGKAESLNAVKPENFEAILKAVNVK